MGKYIFSKKAVEDLTTIWHYTVEKWSEKQADIYYYLLIEGCKYLTENQKVGKRYDEIFDGLRGYKVKHHIIFYLRPHSIRNVKIRAASFCDLQPSLISRDARITPSSTC